MNVKCMNSVCESLGNSVLERSMDEDNSISVHKIVQKKEQQKNERIKMSSGATLISKSTELLPLPLSLVMNHPALKSLEVRLPLLHTLVDSNKNITHVVVDEYEILENERFEVLHSFNKFNVNIHPASKVLLHNLINQQSQNGNYDKQSGISLIEKEIISNCAPEDFKQNLTFVDVESANMLSEMKGKIPGVNFCTIPKGKIKLGQTSTGEWIICSRQPIKNVVCENSVERKNMDTYEHWNKTEAVLLTENMNDCNIEKNFSQNNFSELSTEAISVNTIHGTCQNNGHIQLDKTEDEHNSTTKEPATQNNESLFGIHTTVCRKDLISKPVDDTCKLLHAVKKDVDNTDTNKEPSVVRLNDQYGMPCQMVSDNSTAYYPIENETESVNIIDVKVEPVDTGYENDEVGSSKNQSHNELNKDNCQKRKRREHPNITPKFSKINQSRTDFKVKEIATNENEMDDDSDSDQEKTENCSFEISDNRFPVINDEQRDALMDTGSTQGTRRQTRWGVSTFREWLKERQYDPNFEELPVDILDERLCKFYAELRTADGKLYATNSFRGIRASINRHLTSDPYHRPLSLFTDTAFHKSNKIYKAMLRKIKSEVDDVNKKDRPPPISVEDMHKLMTSNVLSINTPKGLQNKVWLDLTLNFTYKNCPKQRDYKTHMFLFKTDEHGVEYVEILDPNRSPYNPSAKMYATRDIYCPVASLMKYFTKRNKTSEDFFQQPRCQKSTTNDNWYTSRPLGGRQLSKMMENISREANLSCIYTNVGLKENILNSFNLFLMPK